MQLPNEIFIPEVARLVSEGKQVVFTPTGTSMRPFIEGGSDSVMLGSVQGRATVKLEDMASEFDIRAQKGCGLGSLYGTTEVELFKMSYRFTGSGQEVFAFASVNGEGQVRVSNSDLCLRVNNEHWKVTMLTEKDYSVKDSRYDVILNGCAPGEDERVSGLCCQ